MAKEVEAKAAGDVNAAKLKALQATIDKIEKDYGKGTIMKLGGDQPEWDEDAQTGVDDTPGSQGDFCSKMFDDDEDLW